MKTYAAIGVLCSLLIVAPALAASPAMHGAQEASTNAHKHTNNLQHGIHARLGRLWTGQSPMERDNQEVRALNLLSAAGYRQFGDMTRKGTEFVTPANKHGQLFSVTVAANGVISAKEM